jgi:hypothetical protein
MKKPPKTWIGKRISVRWLDPCGFVNSELSQVDVAECVSEGTLISMDERKLILRTAVYPKDKSFGDWTAITMGAIANCRKIT